MLQQCVPTYCRQHEALLQHRAADTAARLECAQAHSVSLRLRLPLLLLLLLQAQAPADEEPQRMEPDKCSGWQWYSWEDIPRPVFAPLQKLIDSGYRPPTSCNKGNNSS